jgi:hypothetical protein
MLGARTSSSALSAKREFGLGGADEDVRAPSITAPRYPVLVQFDVGQAKASQLLRRNKLRVCGN